LEWHNLSKSETISLLMHKLEVWLIQIIQFAETLVLVIQRINPTESASLGSRKVNKILKYLGNQLVNILKS